MWVIVTYDVGAKRNSRVLKTCRKYLQHVQKSVFEGFISERGLEKLKRELGRIINTENDQIAIYIFDTPRYASKDMIGCHVTMNNVI